MEALQRAKALKLDLVEVDRNAKPPVCKIMDYHREKYSKQLKEKDRAKSKSEVTLRKGDCKEVRFSVKTEQKDLEIKANTIKRLMERGYRVKIEDVAIIESGPRVEKKQAYIVVRHIKFGPSKKGGSPKKALKTLDPTNPSSENPDSNSSSAIEDAEAEDQLDMVTDDESPIEENRYKREKEDGMPPVIENRYRRQETPPVIENRYPRPENSPVLENRYNRENNSPVTENRYNRGNNTMPIENRYNRGNNSPVTENRYNRVNDSIPNENRYNRESNNSPVVEKRYRRERLEPFPQVRSNNSKFPTNYPRMNDTNRNGNNFDPTRHPRPDEERFALPYSEARRQSG